jgi:hypothetical protein
MQPPSSRNPSTRIGLIAGGGQFPRLFVQKARRLGYAVFCVAYVKEADPALREFTDGFTWVHLGQLKRVAGFFHKHGVKDAVMLGTIQKTRMFTDVRPDLKAIRLMAGMRHSHDDFVLTTFAGFLESEGIHLRPSTFLLPELLADPGYWTKRKPTAGERTDIELGFQIAKEIGGRDIGQCVVIGGGSVLAVEAIDGTDETIRRGGRLGKRGSVVVKTCKPNQDTRFDVPAVGAETVRTMIEAGATALCVEAGATVVFDREAMIRSANRAGLSIVALTDGRFESLETHNRKPAPKTDSTSVSTKAPPIRVGVVGIGYLGKFHAEKYAKMPGVTLAGVCDIDRHQAEATAKRLGTRAVTDYKDLQGRVDAVSIVVPTPAHYVVSRFFLETGVDVLIEKPMTTTVAQADELIRIAEKKGRIIQVGHLERFNPAVTSLTDIHTPPLFIESHRLSVYKPRCTDVSVILDLMIHDIDLILNFTGAKVTQIRAAGAVVISEHIDIANARLEFETGCIANVTASRISMKNERKIRMFQKEAYVSIDFADHLVTVVRRSPNSAETGSLIPGMSVENRRLPKGDALNDELAAFVQAVRVRGASPVTGEMGRDALQIALKIIEQIKTNEYRPAATAVNPASSWE